jgi:hypothetical protein
MKLRWLILTISLIGFFLQLIEPTSNFVRTVSQPEMVWKKTAAAAIQLAAVKSEGLSNSNQHERDAGQNHPEKDFPTTLHSHSALPAAHLTILAPPAGRTRRLIWDLTYILNFPQSVFYPPRAA